MNRREFVKIIASAPLLPLGGVVAAEGLTTAKIVEIRDKTLTGREALRAWVAEQNSQDLVFALNGAERPPEPKDPRRILRWVDNGMYKRPVYEE